MRFDILFVNGRPRLLPAADLPNGDYLVTVGYSDPSYDTATDGCRLEGQFAGAGTSATRDEASRGHDTVPAGT